LNPSQVGFESHATKMYAESCGDYKLLHWLKCPHGFLQRYTYKDDVRDSDTKMYMFSYDSCGYYSKLLHWMKCLHGFLQQQKEA